MKSIYEIDNLLYKYRYAEPDIIRYKQLWDEIKKNYKLLNSAIGIIADDEFNLCVLKCEAIAEAMLIDHKSISQKSYQKLINIIYMSSDIARTVLDGEVYGGKSFLLISLQDDDLVLTDIQKDFAVKEAMNKVGTTLWQARREDYSQKLDVLGIDNSEILFITVAGKQIPVGKRTALEYMGILHDLTSENQAHGVVPQDIRYYILKNKNWTIEEKQKLIMEFWYGEEMYELTVEDLEDELLEYTKIIKQSDVILITKEDLYNYSYDELLSFYGDEKITKDVWKNIETLRMMHLLRPVKSDFIQKPKRKIRSEKLN